MLLQQQKSIMHKCIHDFDQKNGKRILKDWADILMTCIVPYCSIYFQRKAQTTVRKAKMLISNMLEATAQAKSGTFILKTLLDLI